MSRATRSAILGAACLLTAALLISPAPGADAVFTSTRQITALMVAPDGSVWAATTGGLLCRNPDGSWRKSTTLDGLLSNETNGISVRDGVVTAEYPSGGIPLIEQGSGGPKESDSPVVTVEWKGSTWAADVSGLRVSEGGRWRSVGLPKSTGSHISALLPKGDKLWAAMFGDGLWQFDGSKWTRVGLELPAKAKEITAMAESGHALWIGTRREGIWQHEGGVWRQHLQPDEPYNHNCQAMALYGGSLFVSTLQDGLVVKAPGGWEHYTSAEMSSDSPRQMVEYGGTLYIRHSNGKIDRFDGKTWTRNVFPSLPRKQSSTLAADGGRLYAAQWGGWSEFDGKGWVHHLKIPELQGYQVTALLPDAGRIWVGTQAHGLAEIDGATDRLTWHDERAGLPDDWVRCLAKCGDTLYAGTFVGGLASFDGVKWTSAPDMNGMEVTALAPNGTGGLYAATRHGVWLLKPDGSMRQVSPFAETQALCVTNDGLWIGTRTGIYLHGTSGLAHN